MFALLRTLGDGQFHSGEVLATQLGRSRSHVWQLVQTLERDYGLTLQHVRGRGYRLTPAIEWCDARTISALAGGGWNVEIADEIDSTNTALLTRAGNGCPGGLALFAEVQTAGRGRRGRRWQARVGESLTFSALWRFEGGIGRLSGLSLAVGVAIVRALAHFGLPVALKWPNDVLMDGRKLAGILIELAGDSLGPTAVVIGIGINLTPPAVVDQPVTGTRSIRPEVGRNEIAGRLLAELGDVLDLFAREGFDALRDEWQRLFAWQGQAIAVHQPDGNIVHGIAIGVDATGALRVRTASGDIVVHAGDVSLRMA
ncbi:biotin--[acetyl-CoA-carboxylase] ligase [Microvirgula aerodenitrificans]|uniref:biotin--[acetyl-CoA-carboxylase] ligase n=1 Tax=Microvirgula aerodenitrificans TaxID=57480 RepID=UPI002F412E8B